ncbi:voltage-dependent calcium channel subunit alpha-2/delta-1-like [Sardina pilchardus]|uniref:voltage-dependent calcium channel subunit alpha-2/delta-1-like n=1 Tax=Sardina pilchardus TaxID=27697 RepID=UPI002E0E5E33
MDHQGVQLYMAKKLPNTNLVFLISDARSTCLSCDTKPLRQAEQPSSGPDQCELALNPRYRKGPEVCFDNNIDEEFVCPSSGSSSALASAPLIVLLHMSILWSLNGGCE